MLEEKKEKLTTIRLDPVQFKDLLVAVGHVIEEQRKLAVRLTAIEGELKLIRLKMKETE